jgi:hypothetical protein
VAVGSNENQLLLFDNFEQTGNVLGFPQPVFSVDMSKNKKMLAAGCGDGSVVIFNLN